MSAEKTIFAEALAIAAPQERQAFLDRACRDNAALRAEVEALLAAHVAASASFLESPPPGLGLPAASTDPALDLSGATISHYKLLERIGEGGMGVVYMAEQLRPVKRRVALKIIKPGLDTKQVIARFEAERQALAMMDHPSIAKVFDAGATDTGRSFFVMELVRGIPITEYCDQHQLTPRQRLELFVQVCQAVQHAHQKGIIHRDLKPNNVLVTLGDNDKPIPKVIDFGIAKATGEQRLTDRTLFTEFRQLIGTPLYMSPEQAEMSHIADVDTRSDVYSLGVLLYELLTGTTPFDKQRLAKAAYDEVRRILLEEEPPKPSTRLSSMGETLSAVSLQRQTDPRKLSQLLHGDLDWIVMKALEKDRGRRYETANALARDLERHLSDQPVEASPPSRAYRLRKAIARNRAAVATVGLIAGILIAATMVSAWEAIYAQRAKVGAIRAEMQMTQQRNQALAEKTRADKQAAIARDQKQGLTRQLYFSDMLLAQNAWEMNELTRFSDLLSRQIPKSLSATDLRGFEWHYWQRVSHGEQLVVDWPVNYRGYVHYSSDGAWIVAGGSRGVRTWDARNGQIVFTINQSCHCACLSADGKRLACATEKQVDIWDVTTQKRLLVLPAGDGQIFTVCFSPDGTLVASGGDDHLIRIWAATDGHELRRLTQHKGGVASLDFSHDGKVMASAGEDDTIVLWDVASGRPLHTLQDDRSAFRVCFSADGKRLVSTNGDRMVTLWDVESGCQITRFANSHQCKGVCFSPDGKQLATGDDGDLVKIWDIASGRAIRTFKGHISHIWSVCFSPDGKQVVSAGGDQVRIWNVSEDPGTLTLHSHTAAIRSLCISADGSRLASVSDDKTLKLWDSRSGAELQSIANGLGDKVCFSPDNHWLASTDISSGSIKLWNAKSGELLRTIDGALDGLDDDDKRRLATRRPNIGGLFSVCVSPNGKLLASAQYWSTAVKLWDAGTGSEIASLEGHNSNPDGAMGVIDVCFSPDGKMLASAGNDNAILLWDVATGRQIRSLKGPGVYVYTICFTRDGRRLAAAGYTGKIQLFDVASGKRLLQFFGHSDGIHGLCFSPDGRRLASGSIDRTIKLWDTATGEETLVLKGHTDIVDNVCFSPDGYRLFSGSRDGTIKIWDATPLASPSR